MCGVRKDGGSMKQPEKRPDGQAGPAPADTHGAQGSKEPGQATRPLRVGVYWRFKDQIVSFYVEDGKRYPLSQLGEVSE
jgi:hypothetical protein